MPRSLISNVVVISNKRYSILEEKDPIISKPASNIKKYNHANITYRFLSLCIRKTNERKSINLVQVFVQHVDRSLYDGISNTKGLCRDPQSTLLDGPSLTSKTCTKLMYALPSVTHKCDYIVSSWYLVIVNIRSNGIMYLNYWRSEVMT
jgi:hypothetical protein